MARLPQPGGDSGTWGSILNDFLNEAHDSTGKLKAGAVDANVIQDSTVTVEKFATPSTPTANQVLAYDGTDLTWTTVSASGMTPDADASTKGLIQLAGNLGGSASMPTVTGVRGVTVSSTAPASGQVLTATSASVATWTTPTAAPVSSVAGRTGAVTLTKSDVGLSSVDNTSDADKPISTATTTALNTKADSSAVATALNGKEPTITAGTTSQYYRGDKTWQTLDKSAVGLSNVDNTSDVNKPISSATVAALSTKAPLASPTFTGTVTVPTPVNATDASTKQYIDNALGAKADSSSVASKADDTTVVHLTGNETITGVKNFTGTLQASGAAVVTTSDSRLSDTRIPTDNSVSTIKLVNASVTAPKLAGGTPTTGQVLSYDGTNLTWTTPAAGAGDATTTSKGIVQLAGDLAGTAAAPTVPALASKEPIITAGTTSQYYRGDKTWQTLDKSAVGLSNVDNTSDANKPISSSTQTALNAKAPLASPTFTGTVTVPAPTNNTDASTKLYVDTAVSSATVADATTSSKGKVQLAGDLAGTAAAPTVATNAVTNTKLAQMASNTFKANNTVATANAIDISAAQATAMLSNFGGDSGSGGMKGLVPAPATGDAAKYLKGDGTWGTVATSSGTVTSVSVTTANGVSGTVATSTTTPAISLSLGAITPTSVAATGTVTGSNVSGTNTGDQTIALTGDVSGSGTGSFASTIANNAVTNAKAAQMPALTLKGNNTGSTANALDLTSTQVKSMLAITEGDVANLTTDLAAKANDVSVVHLAGLETITGSKTFSANPRMSGVNDTNGNSLVSYAAVASAVNYVDVRNAVTGSGPILAAAGSDTNVDVNINPKGTGRLKSGTINVPTISSTDTLTNKSLSGSANTFTNIPLASAVTGNLSVNNLGSGTNASALSYWRGDGQWVQPPGVDLVYPFSISGAVYVTTGMARMYVESSRTLTKVRASVGTAPTGASIIVDVLKNGTSIFSSTPANRATIAAGTFTGVAGTADVTSFTTGDYITVSVTQIGSTVTGADLTVSVRLQ